jgi:hypothetical protein
MRTISAPAYGRFKAEMCSFDPNTLNSRTTPISLKLQPPLLKPSGAEVVKQDIKPEFEVLGHGQ